MPAILHVMNGDSIRPIFAAAKLPGEMTVYADVLHEGPVPAGLSASAMRELRAKYFADDDAAWPSLLRLVEGWDAALERYTDYDEVVLWFEHDLFDQLLLVRHLAWFAQRPLGSTRLSLVCIDRFPGMDRFRGLGELTGDQFASLFPGRAPVSEGQIALAASVWDAFTDADPSRLARWAETDLDLLPFLAPALRRQLREFPATGSGLPRTERETLTVLAEGARSPVSLFHAVSARETCFFIGDLQFDWRLRAMASAPAPLIVLDLQNGRRPVLPPGRVTITPTARDVLAGRQDWLSLVPFDRWLGGVHVHEGNLWRWNEEQKRLERD
jgi:hypothetical protein